MTGRGGVEADPAARMWTRRCRACGRDDLSAAFGRLAVIGGPWSCPACRSARYEPVPMVMPGVVPAPAGGPGEGTA